LTVVFIKSVNTRLINVAILFAAVLPLTLFFCISDNFLGIWHQPYLLALIWGVLLFEGLFVFGYLISRFISGTASDHLLYPVLGLLGVLFCGGCLNLVGWLSPSLINILTILSALFFSYLTIKNVPVLIQNSLQPIVSQGPIAFILPLLALFSLIWAYLICVANINFNLHDDYHAYLFFPTKLLQMGSLGVDPFSERRLISGLAGNSLLLMIGLVQMKWYFLHAMDWGLGILIFAYSIACTRIPGSFRNALLIKSCMVFGISLFAIPAANITSNVLPMAIVFAIWAWLLNLIDTQHRTVSLGFKSGLFLGIALASLLTLKSTLTPYAAISALLIFGYVKYILRVNWKQFLGCLFGALLGGVLFLLPWMLDLYQSSGSFFYPLLGKGFHATQYGYFYGAAENFFSKEVIWANLGTVISPLGKSIFSISILLLLVLLFHIYRDRAQSHLLIFAAMPLIASILNCLVVGFALGGYGAYRYVYFVGLASLVISVMSTIFVIRKRGIAIVICSICLFFFVRGIQDQVMSFPSHKSDIKNSWRNFSPISETDQMRYLAVSDALPSDGKILLRVAYPFLMKMDSNLFIADYPGATSPPPGLPMGKGPDAIQSYLKSQGVKYVVWDYQTQANFSREVYGDRLEPATHPWIRSEAALSFEFQENLEKMRLSGKAIYDRNGISIIDLR
jgi:hypothetical protein